MLVAVQSSEAFFSADFSYFDSEAPRSPKADLGESALYPNPHPVVSSLSLILIAIPNSHCQAAPLGMKLWYKGHHYSALQPR